MHLAPRAVTWDRSTVKCLPFTRIVPIKHRTSHLLRVMDLTVGPMLKDAHKVSSIIAVIIVENERERERNGLKCMI